MARKLILLTDTRTLYHGHVIKLYCTAVRLYIHTIKIEKDDNLKVVNVKSFQRPLDDHAIGELLVISHVYIHVYGYTPWCLINKGLIQYYLEIKFEKRGCNRILAVPNRNSSQFVPAY